MKYKLYKKTQTDTGLMYLGITTCEDAHSYQGSGVRWTRHIAKHGYHVITEILLDTDDYQELKRSGIYYSRLWNVVESDQWANLKEEAGDGGWDHVNNNEELRVAKNRKARESTDKVLLEKYGENWRAHVAELGHVVQKEKKVGIYREDKKYSFAGGNSKYQQLGNTPKAREKAKVSQRKTYSEIQHQQGKKNSQYGTKWITNEVESTKISCDEPLPRGWRYGRKMKSG